MSRDSNSSSNGHPPTTMTEHISNPAPRPFTIVTDVAPSRHKTRASPGSAVSAGSESDRSASYHGTSYDWIPQGSREEDELLSDERTGDGASAAPTSVGMQRRRKSGMALPISPTSEKRWRRRRGMWLVVSCMLGFGLTVAIATSYSGTVIDQLWSLRHSGASTMSQPYSSMQVGTDWTDSNAYNGHLCDYCDCQGGRAHPPLRGGVTSGGGGKFGRDIMGNALISYIRDSYCHRTYISEGASVALLRNTELTSPKLKETMQWNMTGLKTGIPTAYAFTKTSAGGRTQTAREDYFRRHIHTLKVNEDEVRGQGWPKETIKDWGTERQTLWIVIEDGGHLEDDIAEVLAWSGLPYIYFSFGPTHHYGNAQQNAAYSLIHHLSNPKTGLFGHGPIISIDDDSNFLPVLMRMIWKVKTIGVWPMGNLGPTHWEGPVYDENHKLIDWVAGATSQRQFPIDNGAFTFRSELLGTALPGPKFWPTDFMGGESEFISRLVKTKEEVEPMCYNCHVAWHNEPLPAHCVNEIEGC